MKDGTYITIQSWMRTELKLKGNDLLVYAIIFGYSQAEHTRFTGSLQYLADWCGATKQGILKNLKSLIDKELIEKIEIDKDGIRRCEYSCVPLNIVEQGVKHSLTPIKHSLTPIKHSLTNNIVDNINNKKDNTDNKLSVQNFELKPKTKVPRQNLYSKCIAMIDDFTDDKELREVLVTFLGMRLEVKEKPIYANQWKGLLNKLKKEDERDWIDIVQQSIDKGWLGFYPLKVSKHRSRDGLNSMTDSHERKADMKRRIADGTLERI